MSVDMENQPVLLSLDGHGFYVLRYTALPEHDRARITFELVDPETAGGASVEVLADPKLLEDLNKFQSTTTAGKIFLIWMESERGEVSWQVRNAKEKESEDT
ncbi:MAG TPA: hypothetical protein VE177_07090 [Candidatus Binatus sp.]|nr:hypothetical protein [Candidatus Binatus sp.]